MQKQKPILAVKFFQTATGNEPVREFLQELPKEDRKIMGTDIKEIQFGWPLGMPLVRKMPSDLWEVRSTLEGRIARTLFTVVSGEMVLLHAFIKKSQKTPKVDLDLAIKRLAQIKKGGSHG
ncbi:MAG: type II toxin-antitoxin system RelE/ParE family toxin [Pseudomonadota bacterium]